MANKFLSMLSDKVSINGNKIEIDMSELGLDDETKYEVVPNLVGVSEVPTMSFTSGIRPVPPLPEGYIRLPSGRVIGRHENNEGSVLCYNFYGTEKAMFIPDCKYRSILKWGQYSVNVTGIPTITNNISGNLALNGRETESALIDSSTNKTIVMTDAQLQTQWPGLASLSGGARTYCNSWMAANSGTDSKGTFGVPAVAYARSLTSFSGMSDGLDIPCHYEAMVIRLEAEYIDQFDKYKEDTTYNKFLLSKEYSPNLDYFKFGDPAVDYNEGYGGIQNPIRSIYSCFGMSYNGNVSSVGYFGGCGSNRSEKALALPIREIAALNVLA